MHLEINGSLSRYKRINHRKARYFFTKDKVDTGEIEIEHFPTEMMWEDFLNKPKGCRPFRMNSSYLMNVPVYYDNDMYILKTQPDLLPESDLILANSQRMCTPVNHRSVLGDNEITDSKSE